MWQIEQADDMTRILLLPALVLSMMTAGFAAEATRGAVTNLPLPRFVSVKASEANVRRGPSRAHRIDWVYTRRDLPLRIVAEHGHWRRVEDRDGLGGWVHYSLLSGKRTALVESDQIVLRMRPLDTAPENARAGRGVVVRIESCAIDWCHLMAGGYRGWARKDGLWGVAADEIID
ncbi:SH3-like domain-containing protein [Palleronia aestuarii]|uniref:SH3-like domain-containing protein n=1 Tax=Palleronia aestuarii TaxID=568105 RepID=A0A2W7N7R4_9RHOB|nr:SH3 domain-containing protein [Palleronia aestuarii]PZX12914.1 SH3-like domain-containing protein [Palleronia aestuarii]